MGYELYFYNKNHECDFVAKKDEELIAIQVCYELNDRNQKRELRGLEKLPFACDRKILITYHQKEIPQLEKVEEIEILPFYEAIWTMGNA